MDAIVTGLVSDLPLLFLFIVIAGSLAVLARGADLLVEEAVTLSIRWGVPKLIIGATIVSLGTTLPEAAVSVLAAVRGASGLALGNAVGSIIADTGLILGLALLIGPIPVKRGMVRPQSWIQFGSAFLLVAVTLPFVRLETILTEGGRMPRAAGFVFLALLVLYIHRTIRWSREHRNGFLEEIVPEGEDGKAVDEVAIHGSRRTSRTLVKLAVGIFLVVAASHVLIPAVQETAVRLLVPEAIIAATLVAFGTSLPELVTVVTAVRKRHGELALGNVLGADILNVLFVSGAAAAVTTGGLHVPPQFYVLFFPSMIFVVLVLRLGISRSNTELRRGLGFVLLAAYLVTVVAGYLVTGDPGVPH